MLYFHARAVTASLISITSRGLFTAGFCSRNLLDASSKIRKNQHQRIFIERKTKYLSSMRSVNEKIQVIEEDSSLTVEDHTHGSGKIVIPSNIAPEDLTSTFNKSTFESNLKNTIEKCKKDGKTALWIQVPMSQAGYMEYMYKLGFEYHHAEQQIAHLYLWLLDNVPCKIPDYGTHQVGVGAIVVNSRNEILCVREMRKNYLKWKIPGGLTDLGEHLDEAAVREVQEETGIATEFQNIIAVRHSHGLQFKRSDLYFVCVLKPKETVDKVLNEVVIPEPVPETGEIAAAAWVPLEEYREMVDEGHPMMSRMMKLYDEKKFICRNIMTSVVPGRKPNPVYHI